MNNLFRSTDNISLYHKENCIHASGQHAKLIAFGAFAILLFVGIAAISKNN